jgi:hypothetical protein
MPNLIEQAGGSPQKQPKWVPIFIDRSMTGLFTQRSVLHDPSDVYTVKYYGGRPDALWKGLNIELTNRLTLQRRPGLTALSTSTYATPPDRSYAFQLSNGTIQLIVDTASTGLLTLTSVDNASGTAVYHGTITGGAANAFVGLEFTVAGFAKGVNNGTFLVTASTATTLTLDNAFASAETLAATAISYGAVYYDQQNGSKTLLFDKGVGAGQTHFQGVGGVLYMGDGVDTRKYTPLNTNFPPGSSVSVWNWGTDAPTTQPTVTAVASGSAAATWQANTIYSTMGLTVDSFNQIWQLISVNADGTNTANAIYGTAGSGSPIWNQTLYGLTTETGGTPIIWKNLGQILPRQASHQYADAGQAGTAGLTTIYDAATGSIYMNFRNSGSLGTTASGSGPVFNGVAGSSFFDGGCHWFFIGKYANFSAWQPTHAYGNWYSTPANETAANLVIEPFLLPPPTGPTAQPIYAQIATNTGTSGSAYTPFYDNAGAGARVNDAQLQWLCLGKATWAANTAYTPWQVQGTTFGCVLSGGKLHVCLSGSQSGSSIPTFGSNYGDHSTLDGDITWVCVGPQVSWVAGSGTTGIWHLPLSGFQPPQTSQAYGGSIVNSNTNLVEAVIISGKSGTVQPTWGAINTNTVDNAITWFAESATSTKSLTARFGHTWAYSFKSLALDDFYAALPLGGGNTPPGITSATSSGLNNFAWTGIPTGSGTNAVSSASLVNVVAGANSGSVYTIGGFGSTDPQVDTIIIWRSADVADGSGEMFELTEIPAPKPIAGVAQPWTFKDFLPDAPTALYPGLNDLIPAPIADVNDPPFDTFLPMAYNFERIWGADGQTVDFSGGPDTQVGNPNEAFPPTNSLPFLAPVIRLVKTPQGLVTFLTDSIEVIGGGPLTSTFFSVTWAPGIGLRSFNALDVLAGEIYFFSADNQFRIMTPSLNIANAGFALGDQFANMPSSGVSDTTWDASQVYVASHQNGIDNCIIVADGNTGWYRLNPRQAGITQSTEPIWSPFAAITNGCQMVQSIETSPGIKKLLVGGNVDGQKILYRDLSVYTDDGTPYDANFVMGAITLAHPGQLALLKFVEFDFSGVSFQPTVSYLLNEISGSFTSFTLAPVFDPPSLYGTTITPATYSPNRYYFIGTGSLARCRFLQIKVDFGTTAVGNELYSTTIFGRVMIET